MSRMASNGRSSSPARVTRTSIRSTIRLGREAYLTVSGQNSNNSVRVNDDFLRAVERRRLGSQLRAAGKVAKTVEARELWEKIGYAAWAWADPGIQFHTTINDWHTCPAGGEIRASNPCSEYMFLDDTACNLASLNLMQFRNDGRRAKFSTSRLRACRPAVDHRARNLGHDGAVPIEEIATLSYAFRTLGLGLDNIGVFDRSAPLPTGGHLEQADGTAWMALFSQNMMELAARARGARPDL